MNPSNKMPLLWGTGVVGLIIVVFMAYYVGTLANKAPSDSNSITPTPTIWTRPSAPLYPSPTVTPNVSVTPTVSITPSSTPSITATPSVTTSTPAPVQMISYSVELTVPQTGAKYSHTMQIPKGATTYKSTNGALAKITYNGASVTLEMTDAYAVMDYAKADRVDTSHMGTVYRATLKELSSTTQYYSNQMTTSGSCSYNNATFNAPCGSTTVQFGGDMNYAGIFSCEGGTSANTFCDNIVKTVAITPITVSRTIQLTQSNVSTYFTFLTPGGATVKTGNTSLPSFSITYPSGVSAIVTLKSSEPVMSYNSVTAINGKIPSVSRVKILGTDQSTSYYVNNVITSGSCSSQPGPESLMPPCGIPSMYLASINKYVSFSCTGTNTTACDNTVASLEVWSSIGPK